MVFQRGAGDRGTQPDLGRDRAAGPTQRRVPQRRVRGGAGIGERGPDVGEVKKRGERIGHIGHRTGRQICAFAQILRGIVRGLVRNDAETARYEHDLSDLNHSRAGVSPTSVRC